MSIRALSGSGLSPASTVGNAYASSLTLSGGVVKNPYTGTGVTITIGTVNGTGPYTSTITLTGTSPAWTSAMVVNSVLQATAGIGSLGTGTITVTSVVSSTSVNISSTAAMTAGTITNLLIVSYGTGVFSAPASLTANTTLSSGLTVNGSGGLIVSSGNVGIGTSSPEEPLHVKSTAQWVQPIIDSSSSSTGGSAIVLRADQNTWQLASRSSANGGANNGFSIYESLNNNIRFVIAAGGNVGIGTTSPTAILHTYGAVRLSQPTGGAAGGSPFDFTQYNDDLYLKMYRPANATQHSVYYMQMGIAGLDGGALTFRRSTAVATIGSETMTDVLTMRSNGNVGIGTSSPAAGLHVVSSATNDARFESGYPQGVTIQNGGFWEHKNASDTGELSFNYVGYQNGITYFRDINIYNGKYGLIARFQGSTSRLGIGTGNPAQLLDVAGNIRSTGEFVTTSANGLRMNTTILRNDGTNFYYLLGTADTTGDNWGSLRPLVINNSTGNVAVGGTTFGGSTFTVNGTFGVLTGSSGTNNSVILTNTNYALPNAVGAYGRIIWVKNTGSSAISLTSAGGTIDGVTSISLSQYDSYTVVSDNTNWYII